MRDGKIEAVGNDLDASGLPTAWPWTFDRFREEMAKPRFDDLEMK